MTDPLKSADFISAYKSLVKRTLKVGVTLAEVKTLSGLVVESLEKKDQTK